MRKRPSLHGRRLRGDRRERGDRFPGRGWISRRGVDWPRGQLLPQFAPVRSLDVADMADRSGDERLLFGTLQGVVNRERPRVYLIEDADEGNEAWPSTFAVPQRRVKDPWTLVERYRDELRGMIVYDPAQPDSINVATTLAGLRDAVVASPAARRAALRRAVRPAGARRPARPLREPHRRLPLAVRAPLAAHDPPDAHRRQPVPRRGVPLRRRDGVDRLPLRRARDRRARSPRPSRCGTSSRSPRPPTAPTGRSCCRRTTRSATRPTATTTRST